MSAQPLLLAMIIQATRDHAHTPMLGPKYTCVFFIFKRLGVILFHVQEYNRQLKYSTVKNKGSPRLENVEM